MELWLLDYGYPALLLLSFLASTLVPMGSEWLLAVLLLNAFDPLAVVLVATLGNTAGALATYALGLWGGPVLTTRLLRVSSDSQRRAERLFARYGIWSLLFSWLPLLGDPLCLVAGILRTRFWSFLLLVSSGKLARYLVVAKLVMTGARTTF